VCESEILALQERLLHRQQLPLLDSTLEAYLAHFNAVKHERGEVPNIPKVTWAWKRPLAFFAGELALAYRLGS